MEETEITYEWRGVQYKILGTLELHHKLQTDTNFFDEVVNEHNASLENAAVIESEEGTREFKWNDETSTLLINTVFQNKHLLKDVKNKSNNLWNVIQEEFKAHGYTNITTGQIARKYRNLKRTHSKMKQNPKQKRPRKDNISWEYFEEMEDVFESDKDEVAPPPNLRSAEFKWSNEATLLLINTIQVNKELLKDPNIKSKYLWDVVYETFKANGYTNINSHLIERKYRNLKQTHRSIKENLNSKGMDRESISWEYFDEMEQLLYNDDVHIKEEDNDPSNCSTHFRWSTASTLLLINTVKANKHLMRNPKIKARYLWNVVFKIFKSEGFHELNTHQIERKYRSLKHTYRRLKELKNRGKLDSNTEPWEFYEPMEQLLDDLSDKFDPPLSATEFKWDHETTMLLINTLLEHKESQLKSRERWQLVCDKFKSAGFETINTYQVERKYRNLKSFYITVKGNKSKRYRGRISWEFFEPMDSLLKDDPSVSIKSSHKNSPEPVTSQQSFNEYYVNSQKQPIASTQLSTMEPSRTHHILSAPLPTTSSKQPVLLQLSISSEPNVVNETANPNTNKKTASRKQLELEKERIAQIKLLAESIQESNRIQQEKNELLKKILNKSEKRAS